MTDTLQLDEAAEGGCQHAIVHPLRVLVACEYSGAVRDAFRALGHDTISCDLLPTDVPGPHHTGDVAELLTQQWDLLIAFPPCTYLCSSGMHWTVRGKRDPQLTEDALAFVQSLLGADVKHIALEASIILADLEGLFTGLHPLEVLRPRFQRMHGDRKATEQFVAGATAASVGV